MPLVQYSQYTALEHRRAPEAFASLASFAREYLTPAPGEQGRGSIITGKPEVLWTQQPLFDVFEQYGANIDGAFAQINSGHGNTLQGPQWLDMVDDLAALPSSVFFGATVDVGWVDGRWKAAPDARAFVHLNNREGGRDFTLWVAVRVEARHSDDDAVRAAVRAVASATGLAFDQAKPTIFDRPAVDASVPRLNVERAFAQVGQQLRRDGVIAPPGPAVRLDGVIDLMELGRHIGRSARSDNPWVHSTEAGLLQLVGPTPKPPPDVAAVLREHLFKQLPGFSPAPERADEWCKPIGSELIMGMLAKHSDHAERNRMISKANAAQRAKRAKAGGPALPDRAPLITMRLIVRDRDSEDVISRLPIEAWFGAPMGSCLTYRDEADLIDTLSRIAPILSKGLEALEQKLSP